METKGLNCTVDCTHRVEEISHFIAYETFVCLPPVLFLKFTTSMKDMLGPLML